MDTETYLFEIPIYRVSEEQFGKDYDEALEKHFLEVYPGKGRSAVGESIQNSVEQHFWETYGMPWRYNQAVGWMRVFVLGSQVRGELWFTDAEKLTRHPQQRKIRLQGKAFEIPTLPEETSDQILAEVRKEILSATKVIRKSALVCDLECFDNVAPLLNWKALTTQAQN